MDNTPVGYCHCGCGLQTHISKYTDVSLGWVKGQPRKFLVGHEARLRGREDLTGMKFGRWTAIRFSHVSEHRGYYWLCRCDCGTERPVRSNQLKNGTNRSCGCLQRELAAAKSRVHGLSNHPLKPMYSAMVARCHNPNSSEYANYGARGIVVCERWRDSIANFIADMGERPQGMSIDRIDNDGPYSPENCRWATSSQQHNNTRFNRIIELNGRRQTVVQWAAELGLSPNTIRSRLRKGWSVERALDPHVDTNCRHKVTVET